MSDIITPDRVPPAVWDERPKHDPRCAHCGFESVKRHGLLCVKCVRKLVEGLRLRMEQRRR